MIYESNYNPLTDLAETVPSLSTDVNVAIETGVIVDTGVSSEYNEIDDPTSISGRVRNAFEAVDLQRKISAAAAAAAKAPDASAVTGKSTVSTPVASAE